MNQDWVNLVKNRLRDFLDEFQEVCSKCGRNASELRKVYATKYLSPEQFVSFLDIAKDIDIAPLIIGENRVQEAQTKIDFLKEKAPYLLSYFTLVMIGNLQKNKINKAIRLFEEIYSIDSLELAKALDQRLKREERKVPIFLEVNILREETKHGFGEGEIDRVISTIKQFNNLTIKGLMTMAPLVSNPEEIRPIFKTLRKLADRHHLLTSMGMSNDWRVAVEEGADMIRIGGRIFQVKNLKSEMFLGKRLW